QRTFVSTVLLSRTWETETVVDLRKEARLRGLSTCAVSLPPLHTLILIHRKGNKPALIARLQEYEDSKVAPSPQNPSPPSRNVPPSPAAPTSDPATPALPHGASPAGTPPSASADRAPYRRSDFWDSARSHSWFAEPDPDPPKLQVVGSAITNYDGGPANHLEKHTD
ncbi:hypothetical protein F5141DRAFT_972047, partial [Pisolithus sp. B1]